MYHASRLVQVQRTYNVSNTLYNNNEKNWWGYDTHNGDIKVLEDIMMDNVYKILYEDEIKFYNNMIKTFTNLTKKGKKFLREFIFECYKISVIPTSDNFSRKCLDNLFETINDFDRYINHKEALMNAIYKITEDYEKFGAKKHPTD